MDTPASRRSRRHRFHWHAKRSMSCACTPTGSRSSPWRQADDVDEAVAFAREFGKHLALWR